MVGWKLLSRPGLPWLPVVLVGSRPSRLIGDAGDLSSRSLEHQAVVRPISPQNRKLARKRSQQVTQRTLIPYEPLLNDNIWFAPGVSTGPG